MAVDLFDFFMFVCALEAFLEYSQCLLPTCACIYVHPAWPAGFRIAEKRRKALNIVPEPNEPLPPEGYCINRWGCPVIRLFIPSTNASP